MRLPATGHKLAILSNGDPDMLVDAVSAAELGGMFDAPLCRDQVELDLALLSFSQRDESIALNGLGGDDCRHGGDADALGGNDLGQRGILKFTDHHGFDGHAAEPLFQIAPEGGVVRGQKHGRALQVSWKTTC